LGVVSLVFVASWYANGIKDDWRSATATMAQEVRPDDGVVFWPPYIRLPYAYYNENYGVPVFPPNPWNDYYLAGPGVRPTSFQSSRVWVFRAKARPLPAELEQALTDYHLENRWTFVGISPEMSLYERNAPP